MERGRRREQGRPENRYDSYRPRRVGRIAVHAGPDRSEATQSTTDRVLDKISDTLIAVGAADPEDMERMAEKQHDDPERELALAGPADPDAKPPRPHSDPEF